MLRVLRSRNYRLFWSGSFIANLGVWVQQIALGWLVLRPPPPISLDTALG